jgi:hypothetical protein
MNGHIADRAGFLAALAQDDPERRLAEEHARSCGGCREALDEGRRLMTLLREAMPAAPPAPELVERAAVAISRESAAERRAGRLVWWGAGAAVLFAWVGQLAYGKKILHDPGSVTVSLAVLAVALVGAMFARDQRRLVVGALLVTSGLFAIVMGAVSAIEPRFGVECTACEVIAAGIPLLAVVLLARYRRVVLDRGAVMAVAAAGALASQAAQLLTCPVPRANPHLLVFHLGGVVLAVLLSALAPLGAAAAA